MEKNISLEDLSKTIGGRSKFWDGFCTGVGIIDGGWAVGIISLTPVGGSLLIGATIGCAVREIALQNG